MLYLGCTVVFTGWVASARGNQLPATARSPAGSAPIVGVWNDEQG